MKAEVLKTFSPLAKKGVYFIKKGKFGILEGYNERNSIPCGNYRTPNFYPWEQIKQMGTYFKIIHED